LRKRIIGSPSRPEPPPKPGDQRWLDLTSLALVEVTSEDPTHPVEAALRPSAGGGWRAAQAGPQTIRLLFDGPQRITRIDVSFEEPELERTQEFALRWSSDSGHSFRAIVRQQWNFSPGGSVREVESYAVDLTGVTAIELEIVPDVSHGPARASLRYLRLA